MKIAITGANGGIGRNLVEVLKTNHELTGVVRSMPSKESTFDNVNYVAYSAHAEVSSALSAAECVVHCAIDYKGPRKNFIARNLELNKEVLQRSLSGNCRLFVYFSSFVVYSGSVQPANAGYEETQTVAPFEKADDYTRLKLLSEEMVRDACRNAGVDWLILRPTVVLGKGLVWTDAMTQFSRWLPLGIRGRWINLIHVLDLARQVEALLGLGVKNEIVNFGTADYPTERYFDYISRLSRRKTVFLPDVVIRSLGRFLPSSVWFFRENVRVNCQKVSQLTGFHSVRSIEELALLNAPQRMAANSLEALQNIQRSLVPFKAYGLGYSLLVNPPSGNETKVTLEDYKGVVSLQGQRVTVKAGTLISELSAFLDKHDLALPTLPEFSGVSVAACFFTPVHGSSKEYFALQDLIEEVQYLDEHGEVVTSRRDQEDWEKLRQRQTGFILTELTFRCEKAGYLTNRIEWRDDDVLLEYVAEGYRRNFSTTIQWYPAYGECLIYQIVQGEAPPENSGKAKPLYRGTTHDVQKLILLLRGRSGVVQYDRFHNVLSPWKSLPMRGSLRQLTPNANMQFLDTEICVALDDAVRFLAALREGVRCHELDFKNGWSIGIRFGRRQEDSERHHDFAWIEFICNDRQFLDEYIQLARRLCTNGLEFHSGKYVPPNYHGLIMKGLSNPQR
jgi:nucleoside-diphosphate-sugar epimerase